MKTKFTKTYISAELKYSDAWGNQAVENKTFNAEYIIENGKISNVRILMNYKQIDNGNDETINTADDEFVSEQNIVTSIAYTYGGQSIDDAPTSLSGYTQNTNTFATIELIK